MSRRSTRGYGHRIAQFGPDDFRISWTHDRYYSNSRLRFPRVITRYTDRAGAERFSKKWGCKLP